MEALAVGHLPPRGHRPRQRRVKQRYRQSANRKARARPNLRFLQTRLADSVVGPIRAVLEREFPSSRLQVKAMRKIAYLIAIALGSGLLTMPRSARADHFIGDICRIKGQEENVLHGMGLVVGLKGTGDGDNKPTMRALGHYMELLGHRIGTSPQAQPMLDELKNVKNVALVYVTATIPPGGAQQGDSLDCTVSAVAAKSLDGGRLMLTELYGPL